MRELPKSYFARCDRVKELLAEFRLPNEAMTFCTTLEHMAAESARHYAAHGDVIHQAALNHTWRVAEQKKTGFISAIIDNYYYLNKPSDLEAAVSNYAKAIDQFRDCCVEDFRTAVPLSMAGYLSLCAADIRSQLGESKQFWQPQQSIQEILARTSSKGDPLRATNKPPPQIDTSAASFSPSTRSKALQTSAIERAERAIKESRTLAAYDALMEIKLPDTKHALGKYFAAPEITAQHAQNQGSSVRAKDMYLLHWKLTRHITGLCEAIALASMNPEQRDHWKKEISRFYDAVSSDLARLHDDSPNAGIPCDAFVAGKEEIIAALRERAATRQAAPEMERPLLDLTYRGRIKGDSARITGLG